MPKLPEEEVALTLPDPMIQVLSQLFRNCLPPPPPPLLFDQGMISGALHRFRMRRMAANARDSAALHAALAAEIELKVELLSTLMNIPAKMKHAANETKRVEKKAAIELKTLRIAKKRGMIEFQREMLEFKAMQRELQDDTPA